MEREKLIIGFSVLVAGLCSIVYELLISTTSAYFLGDSVRQFSLTIGIYMAAMGGGSYLSKFINRRELAVFIAVELLLGLTGGAAVPLLYLGFDQLSIAGYQVLTLSLTAVIGLLTGFEIPLLARIMKTYYPWNANLANVLSLDYLGALLATLLFPFLLLPFFGLFQTSVGTGMVNVALGLFVAGVFGGRLTQRQRRWLFITGLLSLLGFVVLLFGAHRLLSFAESNAFPHRVIYSRQTPYQRLTLTGNQDELRLYINRVIQFSSRDEYRYHESLALLPASAHGQVRRVCILGGGEGLLAREVLRLPDVERVVIVDLDAEVFRLAREHPRVRALNERALFDPRVEAVTQDAGLFLRFDTARYDLILADLPDPATEGVARLYSTHFFRQVRERLAPGGYFATQAGSPYHTRKAYWCIYETAAAVFDHAGAYHAYVPSFGDWGFVLAGEEAPAGFRLPPDVRLRFLDLDEPDRYFYFPRDQDHPGEISINTLDRPTLLDYYLSEWRTWQRE